MPTRCWNLGINNQTRTDVVDVDAPIVFVGYGIDAPEYHWNDFKGVDEQVYLRNDRDPKLQARRLGSSWMWRDNCSRHDEFEAIRLHGGAGH